MDSNLNTIIDTNTLPPPPSNSPRYIQLAHQCLLESLRQGDCVLKWNLQGYRLEVSNDSQVLPQQLHSYLRVYLEWLERPQTINVAESDDAADANFRGETTGCVWIPQPNGGMLIARMLINGGRFDAWEVLANALMLGAIKWTDEKGLYVAAEQIETFVSMLAKSIVQGTYESRLDKEIGNNSETASI